MFTRPPPVETGFHLLCHLQQLEAHAGPIKPEEEGEELALKEEGEEVVLESTYKTIFACQAIQMLVF